MSWSSGKDSAWALHEVQESGDVDVVGLLTSYNEAADRIAMHGVRRTLLQAQARMVGLPLTEVGLPPDCSNAEYESRIAEALSRARDDDEITHVVFGDLFLADIRSYRERQLAALELQPVFPLWERPTGQLAEQMLKGGLKAVISCVDTEQIPAEFSGRMFDAEFLAERPEHVDACGENGEFHTFVFDGPMFNHPIEIQTGDRHSDPRFVFTDLVPGPRDEDR